MPIQDLEIRRLNLRAASAAEYAAFNAFENVIRAEEIPDDPPIPCDEETALCKALPDFVKAESWAAWERGSGRMVAYATVEAETSGDNAHLADFTVEVLPEHRRQGLGREMLRRVLPFARSENRRMLLSLSRAHVPASVAFLERIGARPGSEGGLNQLKLADVDRGLVADWLRRGDSLLDEFCLELWEGPVPEKYLAGMSALIQELINDSPRDDLEIEDASHISGTFRAFEAWEMAAGRRRWELVAIHRADDRVAGMTGLIWSPNRPAIIEQHGTGTLRAFRNRGIGRWLKAAMLTKILNELPEARVIRTGNASSNAPMLKINYELGFKPFQSATFWQVETETVEKYLAQSAEAVS